jgi:hypothetical protein
VSRYGKYLSEIRGCSAKIYISSSFLIPLLLLIVKVPLSHSRHRLHYGCIKRLNVAHKRIANDTNKCWWVIHVRATSVIKLVESLLANLASPDKVMNVRSD